MQVILQLLISNTDSLSHLEPPDSLFILMIGLRLPVLAPRQLSGVSVFSVPSRALMNPLDQKREPLNPMRLVSLLFHFLWTDIFGNPATDWLQEGGLRAVSYSGST